MSDATKPAKVVVGTVFGRAMCDYLGLPANQVEQDFYFHTGADEIFGVTLRVSLTADDMAGIAERMQRITETMPGYASEPAAKLDADARTHDVCGQPLTGPLVLGEMLALEPDPRLDEIIVLLKQLVTLRITAADMEMITHRRFDGIECRASAPGLHGGMAGK